MASRNKHFHPDLEPMRSHESLRLLEDKVNGPFGFLNPTQARYAHTHHSAKTSGLDKDSDSDKEKPDSTTDAPADDQDTPQAASNVSYKWTSRNNRKGRHSLVIKPADPNSPGAKYETPRLSSNWRTILQNTWRMFVCYPYWDVSWWVAYIFTWGSIIWVINAFFDFLPDLRPSTLFTNEILVGGGVTAFIGATVFELGSVLLMLEAINENRTACFGWAVEQVYDSEFGGGGHKHSSEKGGILRIRPDKKRCHHHHQNRKNFVGKPQETANTPSGTSANGSKTDKSWVWWPSSYDLRTKYIHDLGFLACCSQLFGASVFWISGFTALPGINNKLSSAALNGAYWFPQILGGSGFIVSGTLFMIETQKHWWQPAPSVLGWHIGLWNLIGGVGFTLCPAFGIDTASWAQYQASCSTFWGSWAFLIGSLIQLYESLEKNPVEVDKSGSQPQDDSSQKQSIGA